VDSSGRSTHKRIDNQSRALQLNGAKMPIPDCFLMIAVFTGLSTNKNPKVQINMALEKKLKKFLKIF
jgi:hypothetical protein